MKVSATAIDVGELVVTDVACSGASAQVEAAIVAVLNGTITYDIEGSVLHLRDGTGKGLTLRSD